MFVSIYVCIIRLIIHDKRFIHLLFKWMTAPLQCFDLCIIFLHYILNYNKKDTVATMHFLLKNKLCCMYTSIIGWWPSDSWWWLLVNGDYRLSWWWRWCHCSHCSCSVSCCLLITTSDNYWSDSVHSLWVHIFDLCQHVSAVIRCSNVSQIIL